MKLLRFSVLVLVLLGLGACDFLSYRETTRLDKEWVFNSFNRTRRFLSNIYSRVPAGFNSVGGAMRASAIDDAEEIDDRAAVQEMNNGSWSAINLVDAEWGAMYGGIRAANRLLEEFDIDALDEIRFNDDYERRMAQAQLWRYEARWLRAYFYFELFKRYGGVPLVTKVLTKEEANSVKRASAQEIVDFIVSEMEAIAPELPLSYSNIPRQETGRATRGAALALKARTLLYAASPLHNPSGDRSKWVRAAKAFEAVIDLGIYSLEDEYSAVFNSWTSEELIWGRRRDDFNFFERINIPVGFVGATSGGTAPTQNLVSAYAMQTTGKRIHEPGSGWDPQNRYENRDPRLYQTIMLPGSEWNGRTVESWTGGLDGPPQEGASSTGYYLKKHLVEDVSLDPGNSTTARHVWPAFRYAAVLLGYAEAMNEAYGPYSASGTGMTAAQAVNKVRARVNMPPVPSGLTKEEFRQVVRHERRVELAFEGHRFWDVRRWMIGPSTTDIYGMEITRTSDTSFTYEKVLLEERFWNDRMYLYPIPQSELFINPALKQNPGW